MPEEVFDNPTGWVADHVRRYAESGGARGHRFNGNAALLLTTRGRRTGRLRRTALYYGRDGERYVLVATAVRGGGDPAWYLNLLHNPAVVVQVRSEVFGAVARPADAGERLRLWELMVDLVPKYLVWEEQAGRELAVVVLEPAAGRDRDPRRGAGDASVRACDLPRLRACARDARAERFTGPDGPRNAVQGSGPARGVRLPHLPLGGPGRG